ncbi:hypothetical protein JCM8547_000041 [Rhodosporidiobolus lusitaniae]
MPAPIRLPSEPSALSRSFASFKRIRGPRELWKWSFASFRLAELPLRIRPAFILYTFLALLLLSLLGFHPTIAQHVAPSSVPFSDKILHFVCFFFATMLFYRIFVVEESARRVWWWAWFNELVTFGVCVFTGGILSEFIQSLLPYKTFQAGDILANLLGSSLALFLSSRLAAQARRDAELRRLYSHIGEMSDSEEDDAEAEEREGLAGAAGREMEEGRVRAEGKLGSAGEGRPGVRRARSGTVQDPWNASLGEDEIFGLGDEDGEEGDYRGKGKERGPL